MKGKMKIKDIMQKRLVWIEQGKTVKQALDKMLMERVSSILIKLNSKDGFGIVTRKDIIYNIVSEGVDPNQILVDDIMSEPLITISQEKPLDEVARLMKEKDIRHLPVSNGNDLVGFITNSHILKEKAKLEGIQTIA